MPDSNCFKDNVVRCKNNYSHPAAIESNLFMVIVPSLKINSVINPTPIVNTFISL